MNTVDTTLYALLNADAGTPLWRIYLAVFASDVLPAAMVLAIAALALLRPDRRRTLGLALTSLLVTWIAVNAFRGWLPMPRPAALHMGIQWLPHGERGSFPSLHASGSFAVAMFYFFDRRDRWAALLLAGATAVALSRVYLGLHFPTDVMAGALFGTLVALGVGQAAAWAGALVQPAASRVPPPSAVERRAPSGP